MSGRRVRPVAVIILGHAFWLCGLLSAAAQTVPAVGGTIVVMPFTNVTGQSADDWIGAGIAEVLAVDLSQLDRSVMGEGVIRDAVMNGARREREVDPDDAAVLAGARQVGATWLVSGTFQHLGSDLRVTARVVEVSNGGVAHTVKIDGSMHDLFAVQDRVAEAIVERLAEPPARAQTTVVPRDRQAPPSEVVRTDDVLGPGSVTGALTLNLPEGVEASSGAATGAGFMRPVRSTSPGGPFAHRDPR